MLSSPFATTARQDIVRLCHSGLDSVSLRREVMRRLRRTLPVDSFWFATVDPTTLLFTGALAEAIPEKATPLFVANEFLQNDVNKWTQLAAARPSVNSLYFATKGRLLDSPRYRDICVPFGFGDELRAAVLTGSACWGFMCLHREHHGSHFTKSETSLLAEIVPHVGQGLRAALLIDHAEKTDDSAGPGLLLLSEDLSLVASTTAGERWLSSTSPTLTYSTSMRAPISPVTAAFVRVRQAMNTPSVR